MLAAVLQGLRTENLLAENTTFLLKKMDEIGMPRPSYLRQHGISIGGNNYGKPTESGAEVW